MEEPSRAINTGWIQREERRVRGFPPGESDVWALCAEHFRKKGRGEKEERFPEVLEWECWSRKVVVSLAMYMLSAEDITSSPEKQAKAHV